MIKYLILLISFSALADVDVFKRELDFIKAQKQTLEKQLIQIKDQKAKTSSDLNFKIDSLHKEKARLQAELETLDSETASYSLAAKKQIQSEAAFTDRSNWTKLKNEEMKYFVNTDITVKSDNLLSLLDQQSQMISAMSQLFVARKSYLDNQQSLTEGDVFHFGPFARYLEKEDKWKILALNDTGYYAETSESTLNKSISETPVVMAAFIQLPFNKAQPILKEKNTFNKILDVLPALFLALIFLAIGWIFIQLAKS